MPRLTLAASFLALVLTSASTHAQRATPVFPHPVHSSQLRMAARDFSDGPLLGHSPVREQEDTIADSTAQRGGTSAWAAVASAVVPGSGQLILRQRRAALYLALEILALSSYASHSRAARRARDGYRSLASSVARAPFSQLRPVGDFDYYERMEHYLASGRYDLASNGMPIRPEEDTTTFNGAMWLLARRTYWNDPGEPPPRESVEWIRAESFYIQRAIRPEYRWSWEGADAEYDSFRRLIRRSNDRYRDALSDLGWTLGNHVLSAIDASVSIRLERRQTALGSEYGVILSVPWGASP